MHIRAVQISVLSAVAIIVTVIWLRSPQDGETIEAVTDVDAAVAHANWNSRSPETAEEICQYYRSALLDREEEPPVIFRIRRPLDLGDLPEKVGPGIRMTSVEIQTFGSLRIAPSSDSKFPWDLVRGSGDSNSSSSVVASGITPEIVAEDACRHLCEWIQTVDPEFRWISPHTTDVAANTR